MGVGRRAEGVERKDDAPVMVTGQCAEGAEAAPAATRPPAQTQFTASAMAEVRRIAGDDPAERARLRAATLTLARREHAIPVLPELVEDAASRLGMPIPGQKPDKPAPAIPHMGHTPAAASPPDMPPSPVHPAVGPAPDQPGHPTPTPTPTPTPAPTPSATVAPDEAVATQPRARPRPRLLNVALRAALAVVVAIGVSVYAVGVDPRGDPAVSGLWDRVTGRMEDVRAWVAQIGLATPPAAGVGDPSGQRIESAVTPGAPAIVDLPTAHEAADAAAGRTGPAVPSSPPMSPSPSDASEPMQEPSAPEMLAPEMLAPEMLAPEMPAPEMRAPETPARDTAAREPAAPALPEPALPEPALPESALPEPAWAEPASPETVPPGTPLPEVLPPDTPEPETMLPDGRPIAADTSDRDGPRDLSITAVVSALAPAPLGTAHSDAEPGSPVPAETPVDRSTDSRPVPALETFDTASGSPDPEGASATPPESSEPAELASAPPPVPVVPAQPDVAAPAAPADFAPLVDRGNRFLELNDVASARLFFRMAAERGSAEGALRMAMTFDPAIPAARRIYGTPPNPEEAIRWYGQARALGSVAVAERLAALRAWLVQAAEAGDAQAAALLDELP
ncbi:MAG: hypothetical protein EA405_08560 [Rhodospirillales bacterium]|nr:MAG: hypothetical protein EA405_08560 [Rhodospirillales bacterium]